MTRSIAVGPRLTASLPSCGGGAPSAGEILYLLGRDPNPNVRAFRRSRARRFLEGLLLFRRNGAREHARLDRLMDARLRALRLPRVLSTARMHDPRGTEVTDLLGVIALLARTSAGVFLADRDPDLTLAEPGRTVTLVLPEGWRT